jgi:hypothetical protein
LRTRLLRYRARAEPPSESRARCRESSQSQQHLPSWGFAFPDRSRRHHLLVADPIHWFSPVISFCHVISSRLLSYNCRPGEDLYSLEPLVISSLCMVPLLDASAGNFHAFCSAFFGELLPTRIKSQDDSSAPASLLAPEIYHSHRCEK